MKKKPKKKTKTTPTVETPPRPERRERRALSHVGGRIETVGSDPSAVEVVEQALRVQSDETSTMAHVHGFHSYPARLHPKTAARLIAGLSKPADSVLDPFCGSGTVLVEARRLGRRALGIDANPLAVELAWLKTRGFERQECEQLVEAAGAAAEHAEARRIKKAGPTKKYGPEDRELYDVHVLLELDGISDGIRKQGPADIRRALWLVLSAMLTKVSKKPGDTTARRAERRLPGGYCIDFFQKKAAELTRRLAAYTAMLPAGAPAAKLARGDARVLDRIRPGSVSLIVTSPPYPGVYDYHTHHAARLRWLGIDDRDFERREIGSRRQARARSYDDVVATWRKDFGDCLREMRNVLAPDGAACLVVADSSIGRRALRSDRLVEELCKAHGLSLVARGSQLRPHFHAPTADAFRDAPRREHVLVLRKAARGQRRAVTSTGLVSVPASGS